MVLTCFAYLVAKAPAVEIGRSAEVVPVTEPLIETISGSPLKIKTRGGMKGGEALPPIVTEVDIYATRWQVPMANTRWKAPLQDTRTLEGPGSRSGNTVAGGDLGQDDIFTMVPEDSDIEEITPPLKKQPPPVLPQLQPSTRPKWFEEHKTIEDRGESLNKPFTHVSNEIMRILDDAERTRGGPKGILAKVVKIAHQTSLKKTSSTFKSDDSAEETGENGSQDILECVRRTMVLEARIQELATAMIQESDHEDGPAPVVKSKEEKQDAGNCNVLLQYCEGIAE